MAGNLTSLDLHDNSISTIYNDTFSTFTVLGRLVIDANIVERNGFTSLNSLQELKLRYVKWDEISPSVWSEIGDTVTELSIDDTSIGLMTENMFDMIPRLSFLTMNECSITTIHPNAFNGVNNLWRIILSGNRISEEEMKNLQSLQNSLHSLDLQNNTITAILNGTFKGFSTLEYLNLSGNQISVLVLGGFHGLQSLVSLYLSSNTISAVEPGSFEGLSSLRHLSLAGNNIAAIHPETFRGLKSVHIPYIPSNRTTEEETTYFESRLRALYLGNNRITFIQKDTFEGFTALDYLDLKSNQISEILSGGFQGLPSYTHINLEHNSLTTLERKAFESTCESPPGKYFSDTHVVNARLILMSIRNSCDFFMGKYFKSMADPT